MEIEIQSTRAILLGYLIVLFLTTTAATHKVSLWPDLSLEALQKKNVSFAYNCDSINTARSS